MQHLPSYSAEGSEIEYWQFLFWIICSLICTAGIYKKKCSYFSPHYGNSRLNLFLSIPSSYNIYSIICTFSPTGLILINNESQSLFLFFLIGIYFLSIASVARAGGLSVELHRSVPRPGGLFNLCYDDGAVGVAAALRCSRLCMVLNRICDLDLFVTWPFSMICKSWLSKQG